MTEPNEYRINVTKAAKIVGVHPNTIRRFADQGDLPCWQMPRSGFRRFRLADLERLRNERTPSYHDLFITTDEISRTSISNLPFGVEVSCNRVGGWCAWQMLTDDGMNTRPEPKLLGGEYDTDSDGRGGLRLDVGGHVIVDSLGRKAED